MSKPKINVEIMDSGNSPDDLGKNQHLREHIIIVEGERMNEKRRKLWRLQKL